ncbi:MAG: tRNA glutamyl-Q(34) synthetase GluQRS [Alphaproteobacteria bacterium]|nr:tRNA glutamyl-Q(34) synthetase GluQRS [Alphaproteobacteria bacterium SS10]
MTKLRFAPSPSGRLHLGHAYSALFTWREAERLGGEVLLRIEDIDHTRCRAEHIAGIEEDLAWLSLSWPTPVRRQSDYLPDYAQRLEQLKSMGVVYPCFCTRAEIRAEIERSAGAPHGSEGPLYPGTCRDLPKAEADKRIANGDSHAWRINLAKALSALPDGAELSWHDLTAGKVEALPELLGDAVLARKDIGTSYHMAVVHDDALQGITHVTRGKDLWDATHLHVLLQKLLDLPTPLYHHHDLVTDEDGQRLATRDQARTLLSMRENGVSLSDLQQMLAGF